MAVRAASHVVVAVSPAQLGYTAESANVTKLTVSIVVDIYNVHARDPSFLPI
jgi:hypothetical protein